MLGQGEPGVRVKAGEMSLWKVGFHRGTAVTLEAAKNKTSPTFTV